MAKAASAALRLLICSFGRLKHPRDKEGNTAGHKPLLFEGAGLCPQGGAPAAQEAALNLL